jgi:hypothetical protein
MSQQSSSTNTNQNTNQTTNQNTQSQSNQTAASNTGQFNLSDALTQALQNTLSSNVSSNNTTGASTGNVSNVGTTTSEIPKWLEDAARAGVGSAQALLNQPTQAYGGDLAAGLNQYQQQAGDLLQGAVGQFSPYFDQARSTIQSGLQRAPQIEAQTLRQGLSGIGDYMNPYISSVVDSVQDMSRQNLDKALTQTADQAIAAKAFGGSRHGVQEGVATAQNNLNTNNLVANLLSSGYDRATNMLGQDIGNNLNAQQNNQASYQQYLNNLLSGGGALAGIGTTAQNSLNSGINNLLNYGNLAQTTQQNANTAAYNEWLRQQNLPMQQQQLFNQTVSSAPRSTTQNTTSNQMSSNLQSQLSNAISNAISQALSSQNTQNMGLGFSNTNAATQANSNAALQSNSVGTSTGNSNTNSSGFSLSPMQQQQSNPLMGAFGLGLSGLSAMGGLTGVGGLLGGALGGAGMSFLPRGF